MCSLKRPSGALGTEDLPRRSASQDFFLHVVLPSSLPNKFVIKKQSQVTVKVKPTQQHIIFFRLSFLFVSVVHAGVTALAKEHVALQYSDKGREGGEK